MEIPSRQAVVTFDPGQLAAALKKYAELSTAPHPDDRITQQLHVDVGIDDTTYPSYLDVVVSDRASRPFQVMLEAQLSPDHTERWFVMLTCAGNTDVWTARQRVYMGEKDMELFVGEWHEN